MARTEIGKFEHELAELCKKHKVAVGVMVYHPAETEANRFDVTEIGSPSVEWIACSGEAFFRHVENKMMGGGYKSAIQAEPEEIKTKREKNFTPSGLMQHILKPGKKIPFLRG